MKSKLMALIGAAMLIQAVGLMRAQADFVASDECVHGGSPANTTVYIAFMGDGGGAEDSGGYLQNFAPGAYTTVWVEVTGANSRGSSAGVVETSGDVVRMNTGYNPVNSYVVRWTGITAVDGSFTVISENVGATGPDKPIKSFGMQGFMLAEPRLSPKLVLLASALVGLLIYQRRRAAPRS